MNERIQKLAEQAGVNLSSFQFSGTPTKYEVSGQELKKFAELIVDECCLKLLDMDEKTKGNHNYYKHAALEVKKHFGVEL